MPASPTPPLDAKVAKGLRGAGDGTTGDGALSDAASTTVPVREGSEDEFADDAFEDPKTFEESFEWWDTLEMDEVLRLDASTTAFVPKGVGHVVASLKGSIATYIEALKAQRQETVEVWGW